jgi:putative membrane protein
LSSTSSTEQIPKTRSATETLASRYRRLFVLPSTLTLLLLGGAVSFLLSVLTRGVAGVVYFFGVFAIFILSGFAISSALRIVDKETIATFRRVQAVLITGEVAWLIAATLGVAYAWYSQSPYPITNALLFGAFVCAGLEFIIIDGVFAKSAPLSFVLAALHPASTLAVVRLQELAGHFDIIAASSGAVALAVICAFPLLLRRRQTSLGHDALSLFKAFMKTWTAGEPTELERIIADHSEEVEVTTKVLRFRTMLGDTFIILPGVHPGPFHPVGSYDLPGAINRSFKELGPAMTLHRPGGHERNLATREETLNYSLKVSELARSIAPKADGATLLGPLHAQVGKATASASAFANDMVLTISFAPFGSDDMDTKVEAELIPLASQAGFDLSVVDAHNSIDHVLESPIIDDPGWNRLFESVKLMTAEPFKAAHSHSSEVSFSGGGDLTENGIDLFMVQGGPTKSVLVLADANNSVPELRGHVARALNTSGYELIEFCTTDSHNLAARGLTVARGYESLGEATPPASIADAVVKMAKLAETRLAPAAYGSGQTKTKVRVFGSKALEEFATLTQSSSKFARTYMRFSTLVVGALLIVSVLL